MPRERDRQAIREGVEEYWDEQYGQSVGYDRSLELSEADLRRGLQQFDEAANHFVWGGMLPQDYASLTQYVEPRFLASASFWRRVFSSKDVEACSPAAMFDVLPVHVQERKDIQHVFLSQKGFHIACLSRAALECLGREVVVPRWFKEVGVDRWTVRQAPWSWFTSEEKRLWMKRVFDSGDRGSIEALQEEGAQFAEGELRREFDEVMKAKYAEDPFFLLAPAVEDRLEYVMSVLSKGEIRDFLRLQKSLYGLPPRPAYRELSLPRLRAVGFGEDEVEDWKQSAKRQTNLSWKFDRFDEMSKEDQEWMLECLRERGAHQEEGYRDFVVRQLPELLKKLPAGVVHETLKSVGEFIGQERCELAPKEACKEILVPVLEQQKAAAFRVLRTLGGVIDCFDAGNIKLLDIACPDRDSAKVFRGLMSKAGGRFQDFLSFYLDTRFWKDEEDLGNYKILDAKPLSQEIDLQTYVDMDLPWVPSLFRGFEERVRAGEPVRAVAESLREDVKDRVRAIRKGDWPEEGFDESTLGLLSHVFPPGPGISREEYERVVRGREDRQGDVPGEWRSVKEADMEFSLGSWRLKDGQVFDVAPWAVASAAMFEVNGKKIVTERSEPLKEDEWDVSPARVAEIGREALRLLERDDVSLKRRVLQEAYAAFLSHGGSKLPDAVEDREEALRVFEWMNDTLRESVALALQAFERTSPGEYAATVRRLTRPQKAEVPEGVRKAIPRSTLKILTANLSSKERAQRLRGVFKGAVGSVDEGAVQLLVDAAEQNPEGLETVVKTVVEDVLSVGVAARGGEVDVARLVAQKIVGAEGAARQRELEKWEFMEEEGGGGMKCYLHAEVTKRRLHAVAGLNMGVCVGVDNQLWNKPEFSNVVLFDENDIARGGMHFELVRDGKELFLTLPGINPSPSLLREIKADKLLQDLLGYARACAKAVGASSVLIPTDKYICSNREEFQVLLRGLNLPIRKLSKMHQFSHWPAYSWQEAWEIRA